MEARTNMDRGSILEINKDAGEQRKRQMEQMEANPRRNIDWKMRIQ